MNIKALVPGDLWEAIEPFLPKEPPKPNGGRPRVPDRTASAGIVFVLKTGIPWHMLPTELGYGSSSTYWRRLRNWQAAGVWEELHERVVNWLGDQAVIDWSRARLDRLSVRAKRKANRPRRTRRTEANAAPSTTSWWTAMGFRSRSAFPPPTRTTQRNCSPSSTPSRPSSGRAVNRAGRGSVPPSGTAIRRTIRLRCAVPCERAASPPAWLAAVSSRASG